ncbi:nucleoside 2-deoxyribosyltransferase [Candidatus Dojkabacteria bacterium]|nr:nucleoside 2-deoxyribosyltransferase [Candidatus Dojkabacteria bacterium]
MKIYFSTSATNALENKANNLDKLDTIVKHLEKKGHTINRRTMLIGHDSSTAEQRVEIAKFFDYIDGNTDDIYKSNIHKIKTSDIAIFESTYPAEGIGYEIGYAISQKKPVLILIDKTYKTFLAEMIEGIPTTLKQLVYYENNAALSGILDKFIEKAKTLIDSKFILIISPEIDRYFEWSKKNKRLHKAQVVRDAVFKQMENDPDWQKIS